MDDDKAALARVEHLLEESLELGRENNRMLRDMRRAARWGFWLRVVLWAVLIILPILLIGPILKALIPVTGDGSTPGINPLGLPSGADFDTFRKAFEEYQNGQ